jgi:hypothetical protein
MKLTSKKRNNDNRSTERGAALVTTLLVATLLLAAGGALLLTTSMATTLAVDSTAEGQAYYCAEAGVNSTLNVLRGAVPSNPAGTPANFRNAADNPTLSNWLNYDGNMDGTSVVTLGTTPSLGYAVTLSDPDSTPAGSQPNRLLMHVTGYGPKGAKKQMEVMLDRFAFEYSAVSTILLRGADDGTVMGNFAIGDSNAKSYSGYDNVNPANAIPVIGVTNALDYLLVSGVIDVSKSTTVTGSAQVQQFGIPELPMYLQSADQARLLLNNLQSTAQAMGRYFSSTPASYGDSSNPLFTFVDGDCVLDSGAGLLVVTGTLTTQGNPSFNGLIMVLGNGTITRSGGGNGVAEGAIMLAKFARTWPASENGLPHPFLPPYYDTSGGGTSTIQFDSNEISRALNLTGPRVVAIREY